MAQKHVSDLMAARRYATNVLLHLDVSGHDITVARFLELLDFFAQNPTQYLELINAQDE